MTHVALAKALAIIMIALPSEWGSTETVEHRTARLTMTAEVFVEQAEIAQPKWGWPLDAVVTFLFVQAKWESWYRWDTHVGGPCPKGAKNCHSRGPYGERCLFQIHRKAYAIPARGFVLASFDSIEGESREATTACVQTGIAIDLWHHARCRANTRWASEPYDVARLFTAIHTPTQTCEWALSPGLSRAFDFKVYWWKLRALERKIEHASKVP
jgi:hypothetical protein